MTTNIIIYNNTFYEILTLITKYSLFYYFSLMVQKMMQKIALINISE